MALDLPILGFRFIVEVDGVRTGFTECTGTNVFTTEEVKYREGDEVTDHDRKRPGRRTFDGTIELSRGVIAGDSALLDWLKTNEHGAVERRDMTISLLDENQNPVVAWKVSNAFPKSLETSSLNSTSNEHVIEKCSLCYDSLEQEYL
jgi:phage tail-like protein